MAMQYSVDKAGRVINESTRIDLMLIVQGLHPETIQGDIYDVETFSNNFGRHKSFFVGPLKLLFWTSGDISLFTLGRGVCVIHFPRFSSGATPADLLAASMAAKPFYSLYL